MKKRSFIVLLFIAAILMLSAACGNSSGNAQAAAEVKTASGKYLEAEVENDSISISKDSLSDEVTFINYDSEGTTIQLISAVASDGTYRVSLNTCQVCSPSPMAYFAEENGKLVCQNCGNIFSVDDLGVSAFGCNPMSVNYTDSDTSISIGTVALNGYADRFESWQGPTE